MNTVTPLWQLCPKCNGQGTVSPGYAATNTSCTCNLCNGRMIISVLTGLPPAYLPVETATMTPGSPMGYDQVISSSKTARS